MSVTCTHSIMAAGAAPREVSWQVKDEARAGGGGGQPLLLSLCFGNKDFRRTRRHCANCLQHFFVAVAICRLAFINRLDPTPHPPTPAYQHLYTAHPPHSAAAMLITATSQSRRKQETLCAVSRQSRVESCELRVDIILWRHSKHIHQRRIYMKSLMRGRRQRQVRQLRGAEAWLLGCEK